ncbi:MAG: hypothetical protein IKL04_05770 [Lachnospiraceae bacterium]|nr:hypothetical protein [Lachnospiraceae bacterium]
MQTSNYWKQFEKTGRIADYLAYVQKQEDRQDSGVQSGEYPNAGICERDRNHIETDAYRGIR